MGNRKYLFLYLGISFGVCWGVGLAYMLFDDVLVPITGELTLMHPIAIIALYSPSIAGLIVYFVMDGFAGLKGIFSKLIPEKKDLIWFPILFGVFIIFALTMHFGSRLLGIGVPEMTYTVPGMILKALRNFIEETGLIGGAFGWIGFLLPYLQSKFKSNITSGLLTGLLFGLWVIPGYLIDSFGTSTDFLYYVAQLMVFIVFMSYIFNATKGNILIYLFSFWLISTGSQIDLYYFNPQVQIMQLVFFLICAIIVHFVFKKKNIGRPLQTFPDFIKKSDSVNNLKVS